MNRDRIGAIDSEMRREEIAVKVLAREDEPRWEAFVSELHFP